LEHWQAKGLAYDSSDPTGPLPCQGKPPKWVPKDITELPSDTNDQTPIWYEPVVMEGIARDEAKQQATLTTPPNLTQTNTTGNPALDPNHSSTSRIQPRSLGLDPQDVRDDQSVWSKVSKIAQTVGEAVRNVHFDQNMHSGNTRTHNPTSNQCSTQYTATHHSGSTQDWELSHGQTSIPECHVNPFQ
jgi:hypothetical protein